MSGTDGSILYSRDGIQWQWTSVPSAADLYAVAAGGGRLRVAGSKRGAILRSEDGGHLWGSVATNEAIDLHASIHHPPSRTWLAAGTKGTLVRATDQARTWRSIASDVLTSFETLYVDAPRETLLLGGEQGFIGPPRTVVPRGLSLRHRCRTQ